MNAKLKPIFLRLALMAAMEAVCVGALVWAFTHDNINVVTVACIIGAVIHTKLAPNAKELALLTSKKS